MSDGFANLSQKKFSEAGYFGAMLGIIIYDGLSGGGKWSAGVKGGGSLARNVNIFKNIPGAPKGTWKSCVTPGGRSGNFAFGLSKDLFNFADKMGFKTYKNYSIGFQQDKIRSVIENPNHMLHFNTAGFSRLRFMRFDPSLPVTNKNITNWELHEILNNPSALKRTKFYIKSSDGGYIKVPNPFK